MPPLPVSSKTDGSYLLVEERDKVSGEMVFNQPAGHLEQARVLAEAALRETLEETGWRLSCGLLGIALYTAPGNRHHLLPHHFCWQAADRRRKRMLDPDIHAVHWLDYEEILATLLECAARWCSPS